MTGSGRDGGHASRDPPTALPDDPESICFDLDDTLYPYREYASAGLAAAADRLAERTGVELHDELHDAYFEEGITEGTFDRLLSRHGLSTDLVDDLVAAFHDSNGSLRPYDDADPLLSALGERTTLGVITDGRNGRDKLSRLGLADHFDVVVVGPRLGTSKREALPFDRALESLDASPARTVYVGDDPRVDFRIPNEMGMGTVRLMRGRYVHLDPSDADARPDVVVSDLAELAQAVTLDVERNVDH